jgi:hypothetical protein
MASAALLRRRSAQIVDGSISHICLGCDALILGRQSTPARPAVAYSFMLWALADVLEAERAEQRGFTWEDLAAGQQGFPGLSAEQRSGLCGTSSGR